MIGPETTMRYHQKEWWCCGPAPATTHVVGFVQARPDPGEIFTDALLYRKS